MIAASSGWTHSYLAEEVRLLESLKYPNLPSLGISFPPFDQLAHAGWPVRIDGSMSVHLQNGSHYDGMGKDEGRGYLIAALSAVPSVRGTVRLATRMVDEDWVLSGLLGATGSRACIL